MRLLKSSHIPGRNDVNYNKAIRQRHAAILGICALVESYPYTVEKWLPELLTGVLAEHTYDPVSPSLRTRFYVAYSDVILLADPDLDNGAQVC